MSERKNLERWATVNRTQTSLTDEQATELHSRLSALGYKPDGEALQVHGYDDVYYMHTL